VEPEVTQDAPEAPETAVVTPEPTPDLQPQEVGTPEPTDAPASSQTFTVKVDGEDVQVSLDEALNGYMRQADYTRKTQEVAQQREELSYAERIAQALEADPQGAVRALAAAYEIELGQSPAAPPAAEPAEPLDPQEAWQQRVDGFIADQEQRAFEAQVRADLAEMKTQFGEFDDNQVIEYAVTNSIPNVKEAAKAFVVDRVLAAAQRQVAERQAKTAKDSLPPVAGGHGVAGGTVTSGGTAPADSIEAAFALAEQTHGVTL